MPNGERKPRGREYSSQRMRRYSASEVAQGSIADSVTHTLREAILRGDLPSGTWLRESQLGEELGVSRTPVREAIFRLQNEGLVARTSSGAMVKSLGLDDILAIYAVRESLESTAARLVATADNTELVDSLNELHEEMCRVTDEPDAGLKLADLNQEFHARIAHATNNSYLQRFLGEVELVVRRFNRAGYADPKHMQETLKEHRRIIDAIAARDPDEAANAAFDHMRTARQMRLRDLVPQAVKDALA